MKILISDTLPDICKTILENAGFRVTIKTDFTPEELKEEIGKYDGLIIRSNTQCTPEILENAAKLRAICRAGVGIDNVDVPAATKKGIIVMNTPGGNTTSTAEHTITLLLALSRNIPQACNSVREGKWERKKFIGTQVSGKTLGVIGLGRVGKEVAKRAIALEMRVLGYDPFVSNETIPKLNVQFVKNLDDIYKQADYITLHIPLINETKKLISSREFALMKDGVRIINCARGGIVNEKDLYAALISGKVAGAALDVFENEPPEGSPLISLDNLLCTPHLGAATEEAQENVAIAIAEQMVDYFIYGTVRNAVNVPSVSSDILPKIRPYINLAEKMGSFMAQIFEGGINEVTIEYKGEASELTVAPITVALIKGLLTPILQETVNYVNAPLIAKERGIQVRELKSPDTGDYASLIGLEVRSGKTKGYIAGTLYNRKEPRIVKINEFPVEAIPEGDMLVLFNNDKPGVVGNIGTILGENDINIARMQFGRETPGGNAISVVSIDSPISDGLMKDIKKLPNVQTVKQVRI